LLLPNAIARRAETLSLDDFCISQGKTYFLLVRLDELAGDLRAGLSAPPGPKKANGKPSPNALGFRTAQAEVLVARPRTRTTRDFEVSELRIWLSRASNYAVTLDKRAEDGTYADRVSLGRAGNNDVVLRHASVSKFHAWFERDEKGLWSLADAQSRNGTRINDDKCAPRTRTTVNPGDLLRFGSVEATVCTPEALWKAIQPR
jgi:hypothetical protein